MVKIVIMAPRGHMDGLIVASAARRKEIQIVGGVGTPGRDYIGQDIGLVAGIGIEVGAKVYGDLEEIIDACDLVIDFSTVDLSMKTLECCLAHKKAYICGTTGFSEEQTKKLLAAGEVIPMMKAANTSFVVNVMRKILGEVAEKLGSKCHIDVIDMHSWNKPDAPSGTAKELGEEMARMSPDKTYEDITFHSLRSGNIPSTHKVVFGCMGERLEITHDAFDWSCFAEGACDAASFMAGKGPGLYTMEDVIGM